MELHVLVLDDNVRGAVNALFDAISLYKSNTSDYLDIDAASEEMEFPKHHLTLDKLGTDRVIATIHHNPKYLATADLIEPWVNKLKNQNVHFDCVLIDDQWGEGNWDRYGQETLLPLLFDHYSYTHFCLFTQHSGQDERMLSFATLLRHKTYRGTGRLHYIAKDDKAGLTVLLSLLIGMKQAIRTVEQRAETQGADITSDLRNVDPLPGMVAKSPAMLQICELVRRVAPANATVMIQGESGSGKELVAKAVHFHSNRKGKPFIAVNCNALAENLLESELFGHEKGAFTGALTMKKGRFEMADKGTLFLDEIGELSQNLQVKLLRVLEERVFERVGGVKPISVDIRIVSATNKQLKEEMEQGRFREDLYYRLNVFLINILPLRRHKEDIPQLANCFIKKFAQDKQNPPKLSDEALNAMMNYAWPGNVRELKNCIERATIMCADNTIWPHDLELPSNVEEMVIGAKKPRMYQGSKIDLNVGGRPRILVWAEDIEKIDQQTVYQNIEFCFAYLDKYGNPPKYLKDLESFILELKGTKPGKSRPRTFGQHLYQNSADWVRIIRDNRASLNPIVPILILCDSIEKGLREKGIL